MTPLSSVYDVSSRTSFQALDSWFRELSTYTSPEVIKMIVGNKLDVGDAASGKGAREVSTEEGERYARAKGCLFLGESAVGSVPRWEVRVRVEAKVRGLRSFRDFCKDEYRGIGSVF
jgi:hypothetical protein